MKKMFLLAMALALMSAAAWAQTNVTNVMAGAPAAGAIGVPQGFQWLIPVLVPVVVGVFKALLPNVPTRLLPGLAIVVGALSDLAMSSVGLTGGSNPMLAAVLGAAGIGMRELKEMFKAKPVEPVASSL